MLGADESIQLFNYRLLEFFDWIDQAENLKLSSWSDGTIDNLASIGMPKKKIARIDM